MGTRAALAAGIALALALTRYVACGCSGPSEEPATEQTDPHADAQPSESPTFELPVQDQDLLAHPRDGSVQYVVRTYGEEPERRFGVRAPGHPEIAADCAQDPCVLDGAWWHGPGEYVFWIDDPESGARQATVSLAGDELEISLRRIRELQVVHRIQDVELQVARDNDHALTLVNRTDRPFATTLNDGSVFYALVRGGPSSWTGARVHPRLDCGYGVARAVVAAGATTPLGSLERNLPWLYGSLDADTVVVILQDPHEERAERPGAIGELVISHVWAVTTQLPPELMRRRERFEQR